MRPVIKGDCPLSEDGTQKKFSDYKLARGDLIERIGQYCSYCEMNLNASLAVEHVLPKVPKGKSKEDIERSLSWSNFLLACTNCNSIKSQKEVGTDDIFWPDKTNTFFYLEYKEAGIVQAKSNLSDTFKKKIQSLIDIVGLDRTPAADGEMSDRRWKNRRETWEIAMDALSDLQETDTPQLRKMISQLAKSQGYWSVWMTIFEKDGDMRSRFISEYPGTGVDCFDKDNLFCSIDIGYRK
ncbi:HNH endonuclease [Asaia spathodeae]|uniref:HNH endonuclease n=1 Tax=Asaia spathodeae TaxID=657016 RepID=UPI002FC312EF